MLPSLNQLPVYISRIIILIISLTFHEFAHAKVADMYGDTTPRMNGRVTLNPAAHLDLMGSIMFILVGFGWAKPVPINPYALSRRSSAGVMWVSLAGPGSNFLLAVLAAIPMRLLLAGQWNPMLFGVMTLIDFLYEFITLNLILALFNLIPLAPLDGDKIAEYFMPPNVAKFFDTIRPYGPIILIAILFVGPYVGLNIFGTIINPLITNITRLLIGVRV